MCWLNHAFLHTRCTNYKLMLSSVASLVNCPSPLQSLIHYCLKNRNKLRSAVVSSWRGRKTARDLCMLEDIYINLRVTWTFYLTLLSLFPDLQVQQYVHFWSRIVRKLWKLMQSTVFAEMRTWTNHCFKNDLPVMCIIWCCQTAGYQDYISFHYFIHLETMWLLEMTGFKMFLRFKVTCKQQCYNPISSWPILYSFQQHLQIHPLA